MITFDIETIPNVDLPRPTPADVKVPGNIKRPESIEAYRNDPANLDALLRKRSLSPFHGQIVLISASYWEADDDGYPVREPEIVQFYEHYDEGKLIRDFAQWHHEIELAHQRQTWVGHNSLGFDFGYTAFRSSVHRVHGLSRSLKTSRWGDMWHRDTMLVVPGQQYVSFSDLCRCYGVPHGSRDGGSKVYDQWANNQHQFVKSHGLDDIVAQNIVTARVLQAGLLEVQR